MFMHPKPPIHPSPVSLCGSSLTTRTSVRCDCTTLRYYASSVACGLTAQTNPPILVLYICFLQPSHKPFSSFYLCLTVDLESASYFTSFLSANPEIADERLSLSLSFAFCLGLALGAQLSSYGVDFGDNVTIRI